MCLPLPHNVTGLCMPHPNSCKPPMVHARTSSYIAVMECTKVDLGMIENVAYAPVSIRI